MNAVFALGNRASAEEIRARLTDRLRCHAATPYRRTGRGGELNRHAIDHVERRRMKKEPKRRIAETMSNRIAQMLNGTKKLLLVSSGVAAFVGPLVIGIGQAPPIALAQSIAVFEVASVRPTPKGAPRDTGRRRPSDGPTPQQLQSGTFDFGAALLEYIELAYGAKVYQFSESLPRELYDQYDIRAKAGREVSEAEARAMFRSLLEERFKLKGAG